MFDYTEYAYLEDLVGKHENIPLFCRETAMGSRAKHKKCSEIDAHGKPWASVG